MALIRTKSPENGNASNENLGVLSLFACALGEFGVCVLVVLKGEPKENHVWHLPSPIESQQATAAE